MRQHHTDGTRNAPEVIQTPRSTGDRSGRVETKGTRAADDYAKAATIIATR